MTTFSWRPEGKPVGERAIDIIRTVHVDLHDGNVLVVRVREYLCVELTIDQEYVWNIRRIVVEPFVLMVKVFVP